jgi:E3 ubiquitin-protein ligase RNF14
LIDHFFSFSSLDEKSGRDCLQFETCYHYACLSCLNSYANEYLSNIQQKKQINCYECDSSLFLSELRRIFSDDKLLLKYQQHLLEQTVDMVWCPRCHHSIICIPSESTSGNHLSFVECLHCHFTFCRRCQESWHPQIRCPKEKIIENIIQNHDQNQTRLNKNEIQKLLLEIENIQVIEQCSKPCPSCGVRIEKNGGCQHMNCRQCRIHFCWVCGWYASSYGPHPCEQKPAKPQASLPSDMSEKIDQILFHENGKKVENVIAKRVQICPRENCRQAHVKIETNNMLMCEKCGNSFCFLCGEAIYGKFHFSEYGCKENTRI